MKLSSPLPLVSVIIPTWNRESTIRETLESVLNQTYFHLEILVCDDGSNDQTEAIVRSFSDPRIIWMPGPRGGRPAIPRNCGIQKAKGEWLAFLDSDDIWMPDKIEIQLQAAQLMDVFAVCTNAKRFVPELGISGEYLSYSDPKISFFNLLKDNSIICSSTLIHASLFKMVIGFPEEIELKAIEDYALWLRVTCFTQFAYINQPLVIYRDDPNQSVRGTSILHPYQRYLLQRKIVFNNFLNWIKICSNIVFQYKYSMRKELLKDRCRSLLFYMHGFKNYIKQCIVRIPTK